MMKYIVFPFLLLALWTSRADAQRQLDFEEDVFPVVKNGSQFLAYQRLSAYQQQNPKHAATYYNLGRIASSLSRSYDPFTEPEDANYFIKHTKIYYNLCANYVDAKEARKNGDYYIGIDKTEGNWFLKPEDILPVINQEVASIEEYETNLKLLREYYQKSKTNYDQCVKVFREINAGTNKIKDLYMTAGANFKAQTESLSDAFGKTLRYFEEYRKALDNYPLEGYDQQIELTPISTFRLQGLTNSNFLKNDIALWDYQAWIDTVYQVINGDVAELRNEVRRQYHDINKKMEFLDYNQAPDSLLNYKIDRKLGFMLEKFDYQSLMGSYLRYLAGKLRYKSQLKQPENEAGFYDYFKDYDQLAGYYMEVTAQKRHADTLLGKFHTRIAPQEAEKYADFFNRYHNGAAGLTQFSQNQNTDNGTQLSNAYNTLRTHMKRNQQAFISDTFAVAYKDSVFSPLVQSYAVANSPTPGYHVLNTAEYKGFLFISGLYKTEGAPAQGFTAKISQDGQVRWLKLFRDNRQANNASLQLAVGENIVYAINSYKKEEEVHSTLYKLTQEEGNIVGKQKFGRTQMPRYLVYDDINQTLLTAFKDTSWALAPTGTDTLRIALQEVSLGKTIWQQKIPLHGQLVDIVRMDTTYLVFCNYARYTDTRGRTIESPAGANRISNAFVSRLDNGGRIFEQKAYNSTSPYFLIDAVKINSSRINLQGLQYPYFDFLQGEPAGLSPLYYSLVNQKGKEIFNNFKRYKLSGER